jgi:hypothetical protein
MSTAQRRIAEFEREIEEIGREGGDLSRPHYVSHSVEFTEKASAESAAARLDGFRIFEVSVMEGPFGGEWIVYAGQEQVLNARHIERTRTALERLAAEYGGSYDDWDVGVHMDGWPNCGCEWPEG